MPQKGSHQTNKTKSAAAADKRPNQALELMIGSLVGMVQVGRLDQAGNDVEHRALAAAGAAN